MSNATLPAQISATGLLHPGLPILCLPLKALPRSLLLLPTWNSPKRLELPPLTGPVMDQLPCSNCFSAALTAAHAVLTHRAARKGCCHPKARHTPDKARPTHQGQLLTAARGRSGVLGRANQGAGALPAAEQAWGKGDSAWYGLYSACNAPTPARREQLRTGGEAAVQKSPGVETRPA